MLEAIGRRLQRQSERCREVLTLASVVGREFDPGVLELTTGLDEEALFVVLDEAAAAGLVGDAPDAPGRLRFSHILVRDALYEDLSAPRRLRLHRAVAEALETLYAALRRRGPDRGRRGHRLCTAGGRAGRDPVRL